MADFDGVESFKDGWLCKGWYSGTQGEFHARYRGPLQ